MEVSKLSQIADALHSCCRTLEPVLEADVRSGASDVRDPCDPIPEPPFTGDEQTAEGLICRGAARLDYLLTILRCVLTETEGCCESAEAEYLAALEDCPD